MLGELDRLATAVAGIEQLDADGLSDAELGELLVDLRRLENRLEAAATRHAGSWDARRAWAADGARTGASWLAYRTRMPHVTARRRVRLGRQLHDLPEVVGRAWAAGDIDAAHMGALARARSERAAAAFDRDAEMLVDQACRLRFDDFCRVLAYWSQGADPDGAEADAAELVDRRRCHVSRTFRGCVVGDFLLDPVPGTIVSTTLGEIERELWEADWAEARARLGGGATMFDLRRTPAQRRADALVEMATRARIAPADGRRPAPLFTVLVGFETLAGRVCELADGTALTPGSLVPWLDEAYIERVVFDAPSRVIDVGRTRRLFTGADRRALEVRDRSRCYHPTCTATDRLQADHVEAWAAGGPTMQANGRLACGHHNRLRNRPP